ncbi:BamA/TamA family outer membrane protein [Prolixibacteraceae bacterium Z1-6]|uniref:BamA/TamA family outer membrane protein n=1 Tax=Draconibacterium aestuarii TaxID=2998507 RepID=A0A9X3F5U4_9BACT|nr:BamA/TamA family outer membrane protein [Prolixibacteraceae bacterium Z1-6]
MTISDFYRVQKSYNCKQSKRILLLFALLVPFFFSAAQPADALKEWKIDSIQIHKNWRTRDKIIERELQFSTGETIDQDCLDRSISQIWNIGNFANVDYSIDSISPDGHLLKLTAKDAFNLVPYVTISGNKDDKNLSMGFSDPNFLGRNIKLDLNGRIGTYNTEYRAGVTIPRQLLYKNMTLSFHVSSGTGNNYRYSGDQQIQAVAYHSKQFSGSIGNPWHTDYEYTFSPNFSWNFFQHKTDTALLSTTVPFVDDYTINYLALSVGESVGLINRHRHQKDGYLVSGGYGIGIGLDKNSPFYHSFGFGTSYYKTLNQVVELSASYATGYSTATTPSLLHYMSSGDVKGIINGQESGQGHYNAKINGSFTYIYFNWFALEHSVYTQMGMADDHYIDIYKRKPRISLGTEIRIWTPMIPWLAASVHFTYLKGNDNWFHLDI